jgi:predicted RNA-binding Zn ribbon-like protein
VVFAHDTAVSLQAAVTLVNSGEDPDTLTSVADLDAFYARFGFTGRRDGDAAELDAVRRSRPRLRRLLTAERDDAVAMVNEMLREARAVPQLTRHDQFDWHIHAVDPDAPLDARIAVETAMAMIDVIRADEMSRLGVCAQDDCEGIVLDLSRNRSKIFCGSSCSNRAAVAAYRARHR